MSKAGIVAIRHLIGFTLLIAAVSGLAQTTVDPATGGGSISADNTGTTWTTLTLIAGELVIVSDKNLIANTKSVSSGSLTFHRSLPDSGWYMLSSPVNTSYQDLLDSVMTQGFTNTDYPGATYQPNVLYYDESVQGTHY